MELPIAAESVVQSAFCFREGRRTGDDQVEFSPAFFGRTQESENVLLNPLHLKVVSFSISPGAGQAFATCFNRSDRCRPGFRTRKRERALACETVQDAAAFSLIRDCVVMRKLIKIETGFLRLHDIHREPQSSALDLGFA